MFTLISVAVTRQVAMNAQRDNDDDDDRHDANEHDYSNQLMYPVA